MAGRIPPTAGQSRGPELSRCRAAANLSEVDCMVWFGVGLATIERVEAGEIEPEDELAEKIDRFLLVNGNSSFGLSPPAFTHCAGAPAGGATASAPPAPNGAGQ